MPRIAPIDPSSATAAHLAAARKMFGGLPSLVTTAANSPAALGGFAWGFAATESSVSRSGAPGSLLLR